MLNILRNIVFYILTAIAFVILTVFIPFIFIKEYKAISSVGKFEFNYLYYAIKQWYSDTKDVIGMFVL